jgi:hypothetical protein
LSAIVEVEIPMLNFNPQVTSNETDGFLSIELTAKEPDDFLSVEFDGVRKHELPPLQMIICKCLRDTRTRGSSWTSKL